MNSREVFGTRKPWLRRVAVTLLFCVPLSSVGWGAESPDKMAARRSSEQGQVHRVYTRDAHKLPIADGPQERLNSWLATQSAEWSIVQDNYVAVAGLNNVTNGPGLKLTATSYDCQQNDAAPHQIATMGSGQYVHFAWTHWDVIPESLNRVDRFVNFHTYNAATGLFMHGQNGETISGAGCDPLQARAGFVTLDIDDNNRAQIVAQQRDCPQQPLGDYCSWYWQQSAPSFAVFTEGLLNGSKGVLGNFADDILYPHITVDRQAGTDWDYVVSHTESANDNIVMWRWNAAVWQGPYVIDSSPFLSYNIAADPTSDKIALITNHDWITPSNPNGLDQVVYRLSMTRGDDWGPVNTTGLGDGNRVVITSYNDPAGPAAWTEVVGDYDNAGDLHVVWVEQRHNGIGDQAAMKHWNAASNTISTIQQAYWDNKGQNSVRKLNVGFPTIGFGDGTTTCGGGNNLDYVYLTFVQFGGPTVAEQNDMSSKRYMNGEVYLSASNDGGLHWSPAKDLTNTRRPGCDPAVADSCPSENWPSLARTVDDTLHLMYIDDKDAGDAPFGQGAWTFNPVMYYRIPGGTNVQPVCPSIAPSALVELTDANGPDCEYNTPPNTSIAEQLRLANLGNATLTGVISKTYINPPSGTWLQMVTGSYSIPVGDPDNVRSVTMNAAGLTEGVYSAQISVTHNDPPQASPLVVPVDFFVFNDFACPQYVVLHTKWLELEVTNIERVAVGPNRPTSQLRGLYRAPRFGEADSGNNSIYDASLIIAKPPSPDTVVYRYIFGIGDYAKGFRALSGLTVDTSRYGTNAGIAYARARQTTVDSVIGIDVEYQFPQNTDSSNFVLIDYRIYNRTTSAIPGLIVGEAADFDIMPSTSDRIYQTADQNTAGFNTAMNLIYQQGVDSGGTSLAKKYLGGMTAIQCSAAPRAWSAANDPWLFHRPGGGFSEGYLYEELAKNGFEVKAPAGAADMHSVIAFEKNVDLTASAVKHYTLGFVTSTAGPGDADLIATTKKAWKFAFGWQEFTDYDTIAPFTPMSYRYSALGSHENGPVSGCCGCMVSKVSGSSFLSITPDADNCTGTIHFAAATVPGTYTATFRVTTPTCGGPQYTDDHVVNIRVYDECDCGEQGNINQDWSMDVFDVIAAIAVVFNGQPDRQSFFCPITLTDLNADGVLDVFDVIYLIALVFENGPYPVDPCIPPPVPAPRSQGTGTIR